MPHSLTFTPDAARGVVMLAERESVWNQVWRLPTAPDPPTGREFIAMAAAEFGAAPKCRVLNWPILRVVGWFNPLVRESYEMLYQSDSPYLFDSTKFAKEFEFAGTPYAEGIRIAVDAYKRTPWFGFAAHFERIGLCGTAEPASGYDWRDMVRQLDAVYEHGVLRPLQPLALGENQRVRLTLEESTSPLSWESSEPVNERREDMQWLAKDSGPYEGQWVALEGGRLVAHGTQLALVSEAAEAAGVEEPLFAHVPASKELPFPGW
jgi:predicted DNA-binding antitoxin AbrB/MazE fold protein